MNQLIPRLAILILLAGIPGILISQQSLQVNRSVNEMALEDFIDTLQRDTGLEFYYKSAWLDSVVVRNVRQGDLPEHMLSQALQGTGLNFFTEGRKVFIFRGDPVVASLPDYEDHRKKACSEAKPVNEEDGDRYMTTISISRENMITVGGQHANNNGRNKLVQGRILNGSTGEPLIGATIYVKELSQGMISDVDGHFFLELAPGQYTIAIDHMAMKAQEYGLKILSEGSFTIELENELIELEEITVIDKRRGNVDGMLMGYERITTRSMKEIPVVMGEKDILKVAQMLPGVQNVGEGSSGFNVRGGSPDQNMFYINNISVYNTSHLFGFFTAFSPDIISDFSLYKNNVPAKYGGRIASIFEINTREGNKNNFFAQGGISPITGHVSAEGPVIKEKVTFVASYRSTYSDWILNRINDQDLKNSNATFSDATLGLNAEINPDNRLRFFYYQSSDKFSLSTRNDYSYANRGTSLLWDHSFNNNLTLYFSAATGNYGFGNIDKNNVSEAYKQDYSIRHSEARADFTWLAPGNHRIEFGANSVLYQLNRGNIIPYGPESKRIPISLGEEQGLENSLYFSDEFTLLPRLNLLLGLRYSHYKYLGPADVIRYDEGLPKNQFTVIGSDSYTHLETVQSYSGFEPRAALNFSLGNNTSVKASYNRLQQYLFLLSNTIALAPTDQWKLTDSHITPPLSDQVSAGFYHDFRDLGINISVEAYKKWISNVVEYKDGVDFISGAPVETQVLQGVQDSRGIEVMVRKNTNRLTGWVSYTWSRSMVTVNGPFDEMHINDGSPFPSNYDRPHSINLVSNYRISRRLSFSSNIVYTSGRPVTLPIAVYFSENQQYLYYSSRNKYRIPDYFRVDLSVNLEGNLKFKKLAHSFWMLNIYNLTGRENAYSVFYEASAGQIKGYKLSIFAQPIVTLSWNFKFGNYNSE